VLAGEQKSNIRHGHASITQSLAMATKKATSTLYHLSSGGFWKKFRMAVYLSSYRMSDLEI